MFETAIRLNRKLFKGFYFYGRTHLAQGNLAEAAQLLETASALRPEDYQAPSLLGSTYSGLGRMEEATRAYQRCLRAAEEQLNMHADDGRALYLGAVALCGLGERERGLEWAERAVVMDPEEPVTHYNVACLYSIQGEADKAIECLARAVEHGFSQKEWIQNDPDFMGIREDKRFQALLEQL